MDTNAQQTGLEYFQNLKNSWAIIKVNLKDKYKLTDADLEYREGEEEQLVQSIGSRLNKPREEVERLLQEMALEAPKASTPNPNAEHNQ